MGPGWVWVDDVALLGGFADGYSLEEVEIELVMLEHAFDRRCRHDEVDVCNSFSLRAQNSFCWDDLESYMQHATMV